MQLMQQQQAQQQALQHSMPQLQSQLQENQITGLFHYIELIFSDCFIISLHDLIYLPIGSISAVFSAEVIVAELQFVTFICIVFSFKLLVIIIWYLAIDNMKCVIYFMRVVSSDWCVDVVMPVRNFVASSRQINAIKQNLANVLNCKFIYGFFYFF